MVRVFVYVVDRDFGFAPNPFHGVCTLATCKPRIRKSAVVGDWVIGMGGARLNSVGKCIFAMNVTEKLTFDEYWNDARFLDKRPIPNGSFKMLVGDNIYHQALGGWLQADSHHSNPDGTPNPLNMVPDTSADAVLISNRFRYFGEAAPTVPRSLLTTLGYRNGRNHRVFDISDSTPLLDFIAKAGPPNSVLGDPIDFATAASRYSGRGSKVVK